MACPGLTELIGAPTTQAAPAPTTCPGLTELIGPDLPPPRAPDIEPPPGWRPPTRAPDHWTDPDDWPRRAPELPHVENWRPPDLREPPAPPAPEIESSPAGGSAMTRRWHARRLAKEKEGKAQTAR